MGNRVSTYSPQYITIKGNNNALDTKTMERFDQTNSVDAAVKLPDGINPTIAEFNSIYDMRSFIGLRDDLLNENDDIFDGMFDQMVGSEGKIKGVVSGTLDGYEKIRKAANWLGGTYSRPWKVETREMSEIQQRIDNAIPAMTSIIGGTFGPAGARSGGDHMLVRPEQWVSVREDTFFGHDDGFTERHVAIGSDVFETVKLGSFMAGFRDATNASGWNQGVSYLMSHDVFRIGYASIVPDSDRPPQVLWQSALRSGAIADGDVLTADALRILGQATRSTFSWMVDINGTEYISEATVEAPLTPIKDRGIGDFELLQRLFVMWLRGDVTSQTFLDVVANLESFISGVTFLNRVRLSLQVFVAKLSEDTADRHGYWCDILNKLLEVHSCPLLYTAFLISDGWSTVPKLDCNPIEATVIDRLAFSGRYLWASWRNSAVYTDYVGGAFMGDNSEEDVLGLLKRGAAKMKGMVAGHLRPMLGEAAGAAERVMARWAKQKAGTLKQAVTNAMAGVLLDTKREAQAEANVYGSMVGGRHVLALPPTEHLQKLAPLIPPGAADTVMDDVKRVGHHVGLELVERGEPVKESVVENHVVHEMVNRTKTGVGQIGEVRRELAKCSEVMKDVSIEKMVARPDEVRGTSFPIHTRGYHVSLVDGCDKHAMQDPTNKLDAKATFSCQGLVTGKLKKGLKVTLAKAHHGRDTSPQTVCIISGSFFSYDPAAVHIGGEGEVAPDHDMNINVVLTAAIKKSSSGTSCKVYVGAFAKSPDKSHHNTNCGLGLVPAIDDKGQTYLTASGVFVGRLSFNISALLRGGLTGVADCPWNGTFAFGVACDDGNCGSSECSHVELVQLGVEFGECIIVPRGLDRYFIFNRVRYYDKTIFDFIGKVDATVAVSEAPLDVVSAWSELISPLTVYLPLMVNELRAQNTLALVKTRYRTWLKKIGLKMGDKNPFKTDDACDEWVSTAILAMPMWMRYTSGNPLVYLTQEDRKSAAIMLLSTAKAMLPLSAFQLVDGSLNRAAAKGLKWAADREIMG
ncbi:VP4 [Eyach virus]|uniref:VP4 n=1 Tax=Eyach virus TaxID=62352 RepID=Q8QVF1_9REOV|nr:VP4 [Eyach virus]AAM18345.1 VP4 [Eyach virus]